MRTIPLKSAVAVVAAICSACGASGDVSPHPTDQELIRTFTEKRQMFEKLQRMSNEDPKVIRIAPEFTRLETNWAWPRPDAELGFSRARWDEYKNAFKDLRLDAGLSRESSAPNAAIYFSRSSQGMIFRGSSKGYAYSTLPLTPVVPSLDVAHHVLSKGTKHGVAYRKITDSWYLSYDW